MGHSGRSGKAGARIVRDVYSVALDTVENTQSLSGTQVNTMRRRWPGQVGLVLRRAPPGPSVPTLQTSTWAGQQSVLEQASGSL